MIRQRFVFALLMSVTATPVLAATATMVQFGSFESKAEAEARLAEVKQKHGGLISGLSSSVSEVPIGEGMTSFRTQAGPVANKAAAQSICAQLASNGDECYVVETAIAQPKAPEKVLGGVEKPISAPPKQAAAVEAPAAPAAPVIALKPVVAAAAESVAPAAPVLPNNVATVPARDPSNLAALANISANSAPLNTGSPAPDAPQAAAPVLESSALQAAMDKAIAEEESAQAAVKTTAVEQKSFWSRVNPFAEGSTAAPRAAAAPQPPVLAAAPVALPPVVVPSAEPVEEKPVAPALKPTTVKLVETKPVVPASAAIPAPAAPEAPVVALAPAPANPPLPLLPPPPAPLRAAAPQPVPVPPAPPMAGALRPAPEPLGVNVPPPPVIAAVPGPNVRVEEAQRVPLTQQTTPPLPVAPSIVPPNAVVSLSPSATVGQKTMWAQLGPFADAPDALAFWDNYRLAHPDFPSVRVRVTNAVSALNRGDNRQWLRVGPFAREGYVSALCASLLTPEGQPVRAGLQCGRVVDMGVASSGDRVPGYLPGSRYKR